MNQGPARSSIEVQTWDNESFGERGGLSVRIAEDSNTAVRRA
jgi:hypothetical protein